jgi:hypothetical protein
MNLALAVAPFLFVAIASPALAQEKANADAWKDVGAILKHAGAVQPDGSFRIDVPRKQPELRNEFGFVVPPSTVLTYVAFAGTPQDAMVFGDTCMLPEEVNPVLDALRAGKLEVVAIHNHMLGGSPSFIFLHFQGRGEAAAIAKTVRAAWDQMEKPHPLPKLAASTPPKVDWEKVAAELGLQGKPQPDGVWKASLPRPHLGASFDGVKLPVGIGLSCWAGFAPCECGHTMVMGDTCLLRSELQAAIDAYRKAGIRIVAIHDHMLGTSPELVFCHFAGEGEAVELARALKTVWAPLHAPK